MITPFANKGMHQSLFRRIVAGFNAIFTDPAVNGKARRVETVLTAFAVARRCANGVLSRT
jgi:hypothetical protein